MITTSKKRELVLQTPSLSSRLTQSSNLRALNHNFIGDCYCILDCAHLYLRKDNDVYSVRKSVISSSYDEKLMYSDTKLVLLEEFIGNVADFELDFEKHVLSIVCRRRVVTLAFYNRETLDCWSIFVNRIFGEGWFI